MGDESGSWRKRRRVTQRLPLRSRREALRAGIEGTGRRMGYPPGLITVSVGIADFDPKEPAEVDLLVSADRALYRAKAAGRNAVA